MEDETKLNLKEIKKIGHLKHIEILLKILHCDKYLIISFLFFFVLFFNIQITAHCGIY